MVQLFTLTGKTTAGTNIMNVGTIKNRWERKIIGWDDKEHDRTVNDTEQGKQLKTDNWTHNDTKQLTIIAWI